jgi:CheY-like chemotaxis protein
MIRSYKKAKSTERILVVDNESDTALAIKIGLEEVGFGTDAFTNPLEAFEHFSRHPDDYFLVLSDIRMPLMSGFELVRQIRHMRSGIKVILMTAFEIDKSEFVKVFPSTIIDGIIQKPFSTSQLMDVILTEMSEKRI